MSATSPTLIVQRTLARVGLPCGATITLGLAALLGRHALTLVDDLSPATQVDGVVALAIAAAGAILAAWLGIHLTIGTLCVLGAATGRRWRTGERLVIERGPALVRRGVALAVGASLGLGGLSIATAAELPDPIDLGWVPTAGLEIAPVADTETDEGHDAGTGEPAAEDRGTADSGGGSDGSDESEPRDGADDVSDGESTATKSATPDKTARSIVVDPGDSLWSITDDLLGSASDTEIARAWPALYEANRDLVGHDPNLIHPGQKLVVPTVLEEQP